MKKYSEEEVNSKLEKYDAWAIDEESGKLVAGFELDSFNQAVEFLNAVAELASELGHHPDLLVHDGTYLTVFTSTHDVDGITDKDFELVELIEEQLMNDEQSTEE